MLDSPILLATAGLACLNLGTAVAAQTASGAPPSVGASVLHTSSASGAQDPEALKRELEDMRRRMEGLEKRLRDIERSPEGKPPETASVQTPSTATPPTLGEAQPAGASESRSMAAGVPAIVDAEPGLQLGHDDGPHVRVGANFDLLGAYRNFGFRGEQRQLIAREVELAAEAQVTPWLYGSIFLTRPDGGVVTLEEATATARLPGDFRLRAGFYRVEFGWLNTIHEPERPQVSLPLPITEFFGDQQLREGAVTIGKRFQLAPGHRLAFSGSIWNGDNEVVFSGRNNRTKPVAGKVEYGFQTAHFGLQTGLSAYTGKSDKLGRLSSSGAAAHFNLFIDPTFNGGYDYPSRFSLFSELLFSSRQSNPFADNITGENYRQTNKAIGGWMLADYQFFPSHHLAVGLEYTQGALDRSKTAKAYSTNYSWYFTPHSRIQLQGRYIDRDPDESGLKLRGFEALLQWNIVLGPHNERSFLPVLAYREEIH
jgi:hypothetical protein